MSDTLRCVIIEDETLAQELLEKYIRRVASLELVGTFDDAVDAFDRLPFLFDETGPFLLSDKRRCLSKKEK